MPKCETCQFEHQNLMLLGVERKCVLCHEGDPPKRNKQQDNVAPVRRRSQSKVDKRMYSVWIRVLRGYKVDENHNKIFVEDGNTIAIQNVYINKNDYDKKVDSAKDPSYLYSATGFTCFDKLCPGTYLLLLKLKEEAYFEISDIRQRKNKPEKSEFRSGGLFQLKENVKPWVKDDGATSVLKTENKHKYGEFEVKDKDQDVFIEVYLKPKVFTIFCHGTGGHRDGKDLELISEFGAAYWWKGNVSDRPTGVNWEGRYLGGWDPNEFYHRHYQSTFLILDGPGTTDMYKSPDSKKEIGVAGEPNPMPGDFKPDTLHKPLKTKTAKLGKKRTVDQKVSSMVLKKLKLVTTKHRGDIFGDGWNDNVCHALFVLRELLRTNEFPRVINLIGWSRGAVTTIKLAYWIDKVFIKGEPFEAPKNYGEKYADQRDHKYISELAPEEKGLVPKDFKINIFAIDPVPGRCGSNGKWGKAKRSKEKFPTVASDQDYQSLPGIVNNCIITLAIDEQRKGFHPIDASEGKLKIDGGTKIVWLPFPGIHRTQLRLEPRDPSNQSISQKLTSVPKLVWDLAWQFLEFHGTVFLKTDLLKCKLDIKEIVALYSDIWINRKNYRETRNQGMKQRSQGGLKPRLFTGYTAMKEQENLFTGKLGLYVQSPGFFINEHHRWCFAKAYSNLYALLMQKHLRSDKLDDAWNDQLNLLGECNLRHCVQSVRKNVQSSGGDDLGRPSRECTAKDGTYKYVYEVPKFTGVFRKMKMDLDGPALLDYLTKRKDEE